MSRPRLLVSLADRAVATRELDSETSIGRAAGNALVLDDPRVSRQHALIRAVADDEFLLIDLGSTNGTRLNRRRLTLPARLNGGDVIEIGPFSIGFQDDRAEPARRGSVLDEDTGCAGLAHAQRGLLGTSPAMVEVFRLADRAAASHISVLLDGATGTGKELIARGIHSASARAAGPFVAVNCAALVESLLESELFGSRRGAFTGATSDRIGLLEAASGGVLFLDEIGEMPLAVQPKLLRVLQEGEVIPLGDHRPRRIDVRVISATNRSLEDDVRAGRFRSDLYYRISALTIPVPPLRERKEDIPLLAERVLRQSARRHGKRIAGIAPPALAALLRFDWPGNIRELQNEIERAVALAADGDGIDLHHFSERIRALDAEHGGETACVAGGAALAASADDGDEAPGGGLSPAVLRRARAEFEARHIADALARQGGNVTRTAQTLGLTRKGLYNRLKALGLR